MNMDSSCVRSNMQQKFMRDQSARMCAKCLGDRQLGPYGSEFELFLYLFVYPPLIAFGLIGNCINLLVLLSPQMRSRANNLLSALAFNDIIFFLLNIPHSAINFPPLRHDHWSRSIYFQIQNISWGFICWASATATWLVLFTVIFYNNKFGKKVEVRIKLQLTTVELIASSIFEWKRLETSC